MEFLYSIGLDAKGALIALAVLVAAFALGRGLGRRGSRGGAEGEAVGAGASGEGAEGELVAIIAAAVAASSGMAEGSFRVASVEAVRGQASGGFNTPVWGHVDRLVRASQIR